MTNNPNNQRHIFVVDDDEEDRELFSEALSHVNHNAKLTEISSGYKLMEVLNKPGLLVPEIIFLDLNMPKLSGIDCLKKIKSSNSNFRDLKVVILSTYSNADDIEEAYQHGANGYYVKPTLFNNLKQIISGVLDTNLKKNSYRTKENFFVNYAL